MNLHTYYDQLYADSIDEIQSGREELDILMNQTDCVRTGITLRIRPSAEVRERIGLFLEKLKRVDPAQYYYPDSDQHITVLSVISAYTGFQLSEIDQEAYLKIIREGLSGFRPFDIQFNGITASPGCVMIQGFFNENRLNEIRESLREKFKSSSLQQSIDSRYAIQTAHSTVVRFREKLTHRNEFLQLLEQYRDFGFGSFRVYEMELVYNDWYHRQNLVQQLARFKLE